ncbi:NADP-dependent oxidoreductase [Paractinoplanes rishiriensis]|uniref:NADPH:quinone reductase n=1 Tax=Paractinoplanes rishiriensis TaxID=1050105 RepID=A0A919MSN2_9ACTN|nr:NADP-dependent oxidoreductase [Actinoplanes rishiriensis]GIE98376.1 NADPH:quinone reductase [Actinoplanes rishiriensis]
MKAIRYRQHGGPDVLRYEDVDTPAPGPGQVLIRVAGTSYNPADSAIRAGWLPDVFPVELPHTPGVDVSGTVAELGPGVEGHRTGDRVIAFLPMTAPGAAAEFVLAPAGLLAPAPTGIPLTDAAALPAVALTAWQAIHEHAAVRPGQQVLIVGAGGGVGRYAVQFARLAGATVLGTAGPASVEAARSAGADRVLDHTADKVDEPVDVVFTTARLDDDGMAGLAALLRPGGVLVSVTSPVPAGARGLNMYVRSDAAQLAEISRLVGTGQVSVQVTERHPVAETAAVHRAAEEGRLHGKVVLYLNS